MRNKNIRLLILICMAPTLVFTGCGERQSLDEKAQRDAYEYNRRYCPTPVVNYLRTDSISFDAGKHMFTYHCSFCDLLDNAEVVAYNKDKIHNVLYSSIKNSTSMKTYVEAGYRFRYVCRSNTNPGIILYELNL